MTSSSSGPVPDLVQMLAAIAQQTDLLTLNAPIEATRAARSMTSED